MKYRIELLIDTDEINHVWEREEGKNEGLTEVEFLMDFFDPGLKWSNEIDDFPGSFLNWSIEEATIELLN